MLEMVKACAVIVIFVGCLSGLALLVSTVADGEFRPSIEISLN